MPCHTKCRILLLSFVCFYLYLQDILWGKKAFHIGGMDMVSLLSGFNCVCSGHQTRKKTRHRRSRRISCVCPLVDSQGTRVKEWPVTQDA